MLGCQQHAPREEDVLRYLAGLDDATAGALLARARDLPIAGAVKERARFGADCACCPPPPHVEVPRGEGKEDARAATEGKEDARAATEALLWALEAGDLAAAEGLRRKADLGLVGEGGWTCLHWAVHAAGTALPPRRAELHKAPDAPDSLLASAADCECCKPEPAGPGARGLLQRMLGDLATSCSGAAAADPRNADSATPLMFAADAGDKEVCEWLLAAGADPNAVDADGDTAEAWARARGHEDLARLLRSR